MNQSGTRYQCLMRHRCDGSWEWDVRREAEAETERMRSRRAHDTKDLNEFSKRRNELFRHSDAPQAHKPSCSPPFVSFPRVVPTLVSCPTSGRCNRLEGKQLKQSATMAAMKRLDAGSKENAGRTSITILVLGDGASQGRNCLFWVTGKKCFIFWCRSALCNLKAT